MLIAACLVYVFAMIGANLSVAAFGPWVSPINAFVLIGLDLTLRGQVARCLDREESVASHGSA